LKNCGKTAPKAENFEKSEIQTPDKMGKSQPKEENAYRERKNFGM